MNSQTGTITDAEYERLTLDYWRDRVAALEDVTVIVRRRGREQPVRTIILAPDAQSPVTPSASSSAPQCPSPGA